MKQNNGFGQRRYHAELKHDDFLESGIILGVCRVQGVPCVETKSGAKAVQKPAQWLHDWCSKNEVTLYRCHDGDRNYFAMSSDSYMKFLIAEQRIDNPYAERIMGKAATAGLEHQMRLARAKGLDFVNLPSGNLRFDENGMIRGEDLAAALGLSEEEMMQDIESEDFQRFMRSKQGWE